MNNWLSRYLQKYLLSYMSQNPTFPYHSYELTQSLFDSNKSPLNYILKEEFNLLIDELNLLTEMKLSPKIQTIQDNIYGDISQNIWFTIDPVYKTEIDTNLSKWSYIVENNLYYLSGYNLVKQLQEKNNQFMITSKGIDFITQDGGLSAILGIQTIKLHTDTISDLKELIFLNIDKAQLTESEKNTIKEKLLEYGDDGAKHLLQKLLDTGIEKLPDLLKIIGISGLFN